MGFRVRVHGERGSGRGQESGGWGQWGCCIKFVFAAVDLVTVTLLSEPRYQPQSLPLLLLLLLLLAPIALVRLLHLLIIPPFASFARHFRLTRWKGAAARSVASTARRFTLSPLGNMGLMYLCVFLGGGEDEATCTQEAEGC